MSKLNAFLGLLALCTFSLVGCATTGTTADPAVAEAASSCETCAKGKTGETVWCAHCNAGYHAGEKVACEGCYKAKAEGSACPSCPASTEEAAANEDNTTASAETTNTDTN